MAQISLEEAAVRSGVSGDTLEEWGVRGLLTIQNQLVEEDELERVVEGMGWLRLSSRGWEETEGE